MWITFKSCIFAFWNNRGEMLPWYPTVVNYIQILYLCILKQRSYSLVHHRDSCELHSNLVSLHSETTPPKSLTLKSLLWITFKSCIFAFWNNKVFFKHTLPTVVNYIQILYLCILKQQRKMAEKDAESCELHSNLVSLHSETTIQRAAAPQLRLWITFKSCIFAFWNNNSILRIYSFLVVNYIQILYLCILKQRQFYHINRSKSCELHSNLVSLHSETTVLAIDTLCNWLWITFKSCIFAFWNNPA